MAYIDQQNADNLRRIAEELHNLRLLEYMKEARNAGVLHWDEYNKFLRDAVKPQRDKLFKGEQ